MRCVTLAREVACKIRVALPVAEVGAFNRAVAAGRESPMRQGIGQNVAERFLELRAAGKVPALVGRIAPGPVLGPMPGGHPQLGVVAISDGTPASRERLRDNVWSIDQVDLAARQDVDRTAEGAVGVEGIDSVAGGSVHAHSRHRLLSLTGNRRKNRQYGGQNSSRSNGPSHGPLSSLYHYAQSKATPHSVSFHWRRPVPILSFRGRRHGDRRGICCCREEQKKQIPPFARNDRRGTFLPVGWDECPCSTQHDSPFGLR